MVGHCGLRSGRGGALRAALGNNVVGTMDVHVVEESARHTQGGPSSPLFSAGKSVVAIGLVVGQVAREFGRGIRVADAPCFVIDDGAFGSVVRIDVGNQFI